MKRTVPFEEFFLLPFLNEVIQAAGRVYVALETAIQFGFNRTTSVNRMSTSSTCYLSAALLFMCWYVVSTFRTSRCSCQITTRLLR